jgi:uncharacterized phage protein gp47/JayE
VPSYPLPTLGVTFGVNGPTAPPIEDIINSLIATFQSIFGSDVYLEPDSQDYQLLVTFATAQNDDNNAVIDAYNSFRPSAAQGAGLSSIVLVNGIRRQAASNSTVQVTITGTAGTTITNGVVQDQNGNLWNLPNPVVIPVSGTISVTATSQLPGNVTALANTVTGRYTPTRGWDTVDNPADAVPGQAVEVDGTLRKRQIKSTALPAQTPLGAIIAAVAAVPGVGRSRVYENQYSAPDSDGIPGHSISAVVEGGDSTAVAQAIEAKKSPGTGTYGTTTVTVLDPAGVPVPINFFELTETQIYVKLTIQPLMGYVSSTGDALIKALVDFINGLDIGEDVFYSWMYGPANLYGEAVGLTYNVTLLEIGFSAGATGTADLPIAFNAAAITVTGNVALTVL